MHQLFSKTLNVLALALATLCVASRARAAISVGPDGVGPLTFDAAPGPEFLSAYYPGNGARFTTPAQVDATIANLAAAAFLPNFLLFTDGTVPPLTFAYGFLYNTTGQFIQSRPTTQSGSTTNPTAAAVVMLATLQNDTGADQPNIVLGYDMTTNNPAVGELPGYRVYFNVTGAPGNWQPVPALSGLETNGAVSATLELGNWPSGSLMYILWFDDNANGVTDPGYTIDNMTIALGTGPPMPVSITQQTNLTDRTVAERQGLVYSITATGSPIEYQWLHNGAALENETNCVNGHDRIITGARSATLRISSVEPMDSGEYQCIVSNPLNFESSVVATLTVTPDTEPPAILFAYPGGNANEIIVVFSEPMNDSCMDVMGGGAITDPGNWSVEDIGGDVFTVIGFTNTTDIRGRTSIGLLISPAHNPTLPFRVATGVPFFDTAVAQNEMTQGTYRVMTPLVPLDQVWSFNDQDFDPGPDWFASDPSGAFPLGIGPFDASRDGGVLHANGLDDCRPDTLYDLGPVGTCLSLRSPVTLTNLITAYFWTQFNFAGDPGISDLVFHGKADDGAVFYLNGREVHRIRLPAAPTEITHTTFATAAVGDFDPRDSIVLGHPPELRSGDNLLAIALHQASLTSRDLTMGFQVYAVEPTSVVRVNVTISGSHPVISWAPAGGRLEFKNNLTDATWSQLGTTNPFTDTSGQPHRFYRVSFP